MQRSTLQQAFDELYQWSRERNFAGHDPFDALNSRVFQATPLKHSRLARLAFTQLVKRSPVNLRPAALVPEEKNSKGIALFSLAALADHRRQQTAKTAANARRLIDQLLELKIEGFNGAAWGYNFDWQSSVFFAPRGTPTIVPTAFAARALVEAFQAFNDDSYLREARSVCDFILRDLPRSEDSEKELCFSYSPNSQNRIFNASLLAAEVLMSVGSLTGEAELRTTAMRAARYVVDNQRSDGSWTYGVEAQHGWCDNFHTAYVLSSLVRIIGEVDSNEAKTLTEAVLHGYQYWRDRFFLADGSPKYYDDSLFPIDTHAGAAAIVTLCDLTEFAPGALPLAETIASWFVTSLRDPRGYFYYQQRRFYKIRTPFMRWSEAWMLYALARLLEEKAVED